MSFRDENIVAREFAPAGVSKGFISEISPYRIKLYTQCPNKLLFNPTASPSQLPEEAILSDIIKYAYYRHTASPGGKPPTWKAFVSWLDKFRFRHTRLISKGMGKYYNESEWLLVRLSKWYYDYYLPLYATEGFINVPIVLTLDDLVHYRDFPDIMTVNRDGVRVFDFQYDKKKVGLLGLHILNDIEVLTRVWGIYKFANVKVDKYVRIFLSNQTIQVKEIEITDKYLEKGRRVVGHIVNGIARSVYYPSHSPQCIKCAYRKRCRFF